MSEFKKKLVSLLQTLLGTFLAEVAVALIALPEGALFTAEFWKSGAALALLVSVGRSVVKTVWKRTAPVSFGGVKKK